MAYADKKYCIGDRVYSGKPFVYVLQPTHRKTHCENCFLSENLKFCTGCREVKYCSKFCQQECWADHKLECDILKKLPKKLTVFVQMVGKVILKLKGFEWTDFKESVAGRVASFADLISHKEEVIKDPKSMLFVKEIAASLKGYIGEENMPSEEDLIQIIGKVKYNQFAFGSKSKVAGDSFVAALYIGVSKFDHACRPNTAVTFHKKNLQVRAIKTIYPGEEKVTISYFPMVCALGTTDYSREAMSSFFMPCYCEDCSLPYGTSILTKVLDETKAFTVIKETEEMLRSSHVASLFKIPLELAVKPLDSLLKKQEGVLSDTHILRMRLLALKCLFAGGPTVELEKDLIKLSESMELAFGLYFREIAMVYQKLIPIYVQRRNLQAAVHYLSQLRRLDIVTSGGQSDIIFSLEAFTKKSNPLLSPD